jgi:hypothetical protein
MTFLSPEELEAIIVGLQKDKRALTMLASVKPSSVITQYSIDEYKRRAKILDSVIPKLKAIQNGEYIVVSK